MKGNKGERRENKWEISVRVTEHERHIDTERQRHRQREKETPGREPYMGLDPGTPGSCPGLKADA